MTNENYILREMCTDDLEEVLYWRNHVDVKSFMYNQHNISAEEHKRWFDNASLDMNRHLLIFEIENKAAGFVQLKLHDTQSIAEWGFYLSPGITKKGTGRQLGTAALDFAFHEKKLHKVCGEALGFNQKSIKFHLALGFQQEGILREQYFDGKNYHDIHRFGLLSHEWQQLNEGF